MHRREAAETAKVCHIQREYVANAMNVHSCGQSRVVHLNTHYAVLYDNPTPLSINGFTIWQKTHAGFDCTHLALCLGHVKPRPLRSRGRVIAFQSSAIF